MTDDRMTLIVLVEKKADAGFVREMLAFAADRMMEADVDAATGAAKHARTPLRENQRNGYRERDRETRAGRIELAIAKPRKGTCFPSFLKPRRTAGKAMGGGGLSGSQVSRLCADIDVRANALLARQLEGRWPCLWLDATDIKLRGGGRPCGPRAP